MLELRLYNKSGFVILQGFVIQTLKSHRIALFEVQSRTAQGQNLLRGGNLRNNKIIGGRPLA